MKKTDVPQDSITAFDGKSKGLYALDDEGNYVLQSSSGWEAEQVVLDLAVEQFQLQALQAWRDGQQGKASPLAFHMFYRRMDHLQLAQCTGRWQWLVKRHCQPAPFARLKQKTLQQYADALGITSEAIKQLPAEKPFDD